MTLHLSTVYIGSQVDNIIVNLVMEKSYSYIVYCVYIRWFLVCVVIGVFTNFLVDPYYEPQYDINAFCMGGSKTKSVLYFL